MKVSSRTYPRLTRLIIASAIAAPMVLPFGANAASPSQTAAAALKASNECTKVATFGKNALANINSRSTKLDTDAAADGAKRQAQWASYDATVASDRTRWDSVRQQNFAKLTADAKTTTQQAAVSAFEATVLGDVTTRRSSVDAARNTFRSTVEQDASSHLMAIQAAIATFQSSVNGAVTTAQEACSAGDTTNVGTTFVAAMKQARVTFNSTTLGIPKLLPEVQAAGQARDATIKQVDATFQTDVTQAGQTLKTALGQ